MCLQLWWKSSYNGRCSLAWILKCVVFPSAGCCDEKLLDKHAAAEGQTNRMMNSSARERQLEEVFFFFFSPYAMSSWQLLLIILKRTGTTRVNRPIRSACNFNSLTMKILKPALSGKETWAGGTIHMQQISLWLKCRLLDVIADTETTLIWYLYLFPVCFGICVSTVISWSSCT